jgi:hypothetical protein
MDERQKERLDAIVSYHSQLLAEALRARDHYARTGELTPNSQAPQIGVAWQAADAAVKYARQLTSKNSELPKRFRWLGQDFRLVFTPHKTVEIATNTPHNSINLCYGIEGWIDPMKVTR